MKSIAIGFVMLLVGVTFTGMASAASLQSKATPGPTDDVMLACAYYLKEPECILILEQGIEACKEHFKNKFARWACYAVAAAL